MARTTDYLLGLIKQNVTIPDNQVLLTDAKILKFAQDELESTVIPLIIGLNQEYFVVSEFVALVTDQMQYQIPYRAIGRILRDLKLCSSNTFNTTNTVWVLPKVAEENANNLTNQNTYYGFYPQGDNIVLTWNPPASITNYLNFVYMFKHGDLVLTSAAAQIASISGNDLTVTAVPSTFIASVLVDLIQAKSGSVIMAYDQTLSAVNSLVLTVTTVPTTGPTLPAIGDYVCLAGETCMLRIPDEAVNYLSLLAAKRVLVAIGDLEAAGQMQEDIKMKRQGVETLLAPRVEGKPTKITPRRWLLGGNGRRYYGRGITY